MNKLQLSVLSDLGDRLKLASSMGSQYDGYRDLYEALGYKKTLTFTDYMEKYERLDIAKAVIDRPIEDTWRGGVSIFETKLKRETPLEKEFDTLYTELNLASAFIRLDRLTSIGRYGVLLLGLDDVKSGIDFAKPVVSGNRKLKYVKPLSEESAKISTWENNPFSPRYGLPVMYDVTISEAGGVYSSTLTVHYSRIIHVVGEQLESEVIGASRLEPIFNRLDDIEKIVGGSAEMFWRGARPGNQITFDKDYTMSETDKAALETQVDEYEHNLRRLFIGQGITIKSLEQQIASPLEHLDAQVQMLSAETGIPKRILIGSERGELASSQDEKAYLRYVQIRRDNSAEKKIVRPFIGTMCKYGVLPQPKKGTYSVQWPDLVALSEKEKAEVGKTRATALAFYANRVESQNIIPEDVFISEFLGMNDIQIAMIEHSKKGRKPIVQQTVQPPTGDVNVPK